MSDNTKAVEINPKVTRFLYISIVLCYTIDHLDLGILAVASKHIQNDLDITASLLGLMEATPYMGNIIGSMLCPMLFRKFPPKFLLVLATVCRAAFLLPFTFSTNFWLIFATRIIAGLFEVFYIIYFPVWID